MRSLFLLHVAFLALATRAPAQHPFSVEDLLAMQRISSPEVSPDGLQVAFEVRTTDVEANRGTFDLWLASVDGATVKRLTSHDANDTSPRFWPDGKSLGFLSTRGGSSQVWRLPLEGGEALPVTSLPLDVDTFQVFPDGKRLLLSLEVYPELKTLKATADRDAARAAGKVKATVHDRLMVRHWDQWKTGKRSHLFVWTPGGGEPLDLMPGLDADCPLKPFGGAEDYCISPDGTTVALVFKHEGREEAWSTNDDLWVAPADGARPPRRLWPENRAHKGNPVWSHDGSKLAFLAMLRPGYEADRQRIVLIDWKTQERRVLTEAWDRSPGSIVWDRNGLWLYADADHVGHHSLFWVDVQTGAAKVLVEKGNNQGLCQAKDRLVYVHDDLRAPAELHWVPDPIQAKQPQDGAGQAVSARRITQLNDARVADARMGDYEQFSFPGAKGETVHGFLVKPVGFDPAQKYPVAFLIHGGPQGSFGDHFHYRWNPQIYAAAGYAAVMVDFHGSTGYGQAFTDAINGDWGGAPYEDLMKGLDHALKTWPFLDGARVAALGASYGGYMVNWIHGQAPDRFRAFVCHDGNLDERMAYFDTEELWFPEWEHGGVPWQPDTGYLKHNPIDFVQKWKQPTLVIHGARDYRVVDTQGLSTFTALQRRGIPSRLLYFPDENHWVLKPQNSRLWHQTVLAWIDQWCKDVK